MKRRQMFHALSWASAGSIVAQASSFARLLAVSSVVGIPEIGVFAVAMSLAAAAGILADGGLRYLYITRQSDAARAGEQLTLDTTWFGIAASRGVILICTIPVSIAAGHYVDAPVQVLVGMSATLAGSLAIASLSNPELLRCERSGHFSPSVKSDFLGQASGLALVLAVLPFWQSAWLLAIGNLIASIVSMAASYFVLQKPTLPKPSFTLLWSLLKQGRSFIVISVTTYVTNGLDKFLIGALLSPAAAGIYLLATRVADIPGQLHFATIARTATPHYSAKFHSENGKIGMRSSVNLYMAMTMLLFTSVVTAMSLTLHFFIDEAHSLPSGWMEALYLAPVLLVGAAARSSCHVVSPALAVAGAMHLDAKLKIAESAVYLLALPLSIAFAGTKGAAVCFTAIYAIALLNRRLALRSILSQ